MPYGITFNGKHNSEIPGIAYVKSYDFPMIPEMNNDTVELPKMDGAIDGGKTSSSRVFTVVFAAEGAGIKDYFKRQFEIEKWLNVNEAKPFIFDVLPDRMLMARPTSGIDPERIASRSEIEVEFTAFSPHFISLSDTTALVSEGVKMTYSGSKDTPYTITISSESAADFLKLTHEESGKFYLLNQPIQIGDTVVIDSKRRMVTLNGQDVREYLDATSRYFKINADYTLSTNLTTDTIEIEYNERW